MRREPSQSIGRDGPCEAPSDLAGSAGGKPHRQGIDTGNFRRLALSRILEDFDGSSLIAQFLPIVPQPHIQPPVVSAIRTGRLKSISNRINALNATYCVANQSVRRRLAEVIRPFPESTKRLWPLR